MDKQVSEGLVDINGRYFSEIEREELLEKIKWLPAFSRIDDVKNALKHSPVVFLRWATGSWKSTQIPKLVCDYKGSANIIITQPRVAAAKALASRVSDELICQTGDQGYSLWEQVWYKTWRWKSSKHLSKISYNTSMYEAMRLSGSWEFPKYYMLDEIHTDDIWNLLLANMTRDVLLKNKNDFKLILSSATMNAEKAMNYFKSVTSNIPVIDIEWRSYPIEETYAKPSEFNKFFKERFEDWDHILVFEPWKNEIKETIADIELLVGDRWVIFEFHSDISMEEQSKIINYTPKDWQQVVIIATNSAEESLTVPYLDTVIDKWQFKVSSIDYTWTERLDLMDISQASYRQRIWRVWRTHNWKSIRVNNTNFEDLPSFNTPEISHTTLEKEILILLKKWINLIEKLSEYSGKWENFLMDNPDPKLVKLSYERLFTIWAIDKDWNITKLWEEILSYPVSIFHSRMLIESIKRWVSKDMIDVVSILENNWFLKSKWYWKDLYSNSKNSTFSDLFFYLKIFRDLTSKNLDEKTLNFFWSQCNFGFSWHKEYKKWEKMLFEFIPEDVLEDFWVNKRNIQRILDTIFELQERFSDKNISLEDTGIKEDKIMSLLSWSLTNIYFYDRDNKCFFQYKPNSDRKNFHHFKLSNTSIINPNSRKSNLYIGVPFIIWETHEKSEIKILQNLTPIKAEYLDSFYDEFFESLPKFDLLLEDEYSRSKREYLMTLKEANLEEFDYIDEEAKKQEIFDNFYDSIKYWEDYIRLIIFLKDLTLDWKKEKKYLFKQIWQKTREYVKVKKHNLWVKSLLENLENIKRWKKTSMAWITYGFSNISETFLNDPIFRQENIHKKIENLNSIFREIKKRAFSVFFEWEKIFDKKLITNINKILSYDTRRQRVWRNWLIEYLWKVDESIEYRENLITWNKNKDRNLRKEIKKLIELKKQLKEFLSKIKEFNSSISSIDFDNILYSHIDNKNSNIFSKKYLIELSRKVILWSEFISSYSSDNKKFEKLKKYLSQVLDDQEIRDLLYALSLLSSWEINSKTKNKCLLRILKYEEKIKRFHEKNNELQSSLEETIKDLKSWYVLDINQIFTNLLLELFEEFYVEQIKSKIFNFSSNFHNFSVNSFDLQLKKFIESLDFSQTLDYWEYFKGLEDYNYYLSYLKGYQKREIKPQVIEWNLSILDIKKESLNISEIVEKMKILEEKFYN